MLRHGKPKTRKSGRLLKVPPDVIDALPRRRVQWEQERVQAGAAWQDLDLVFCTQTGGFIDRANLRRHFELLGRQASVEGLNSLPAPSLGDQSPRRRKRPSGGLSVMLGHTDT